MAAAARRDFAPFAARGDGPHRAPPARPAGPPAAVHHASTPGSRLGGTLAPIGAALLVALYVQRGAGHDLADSSLEVNSEGATTIIQSNDGPLVLIDDDEES